MEVCVHQGSALGPLLFIMVMEVLTVEVRTSMKDGKIQWKERRGCVNKTKGM